MTTTNPFDGKTLLARIGEYHSRHSLCGDIAEIDEYTVRSDTKKVIGLHRRRFDEGGAIRAERWFGADGTLQILTEYLARPLLVKRASDILSPWVGVAEQNVGELFREAEETGSILLIDEADSFFYSRESAVRSWERTLVNEFLTRMEEFTGILVCITNLPSVLDKAVSRRFHEIVEFRPLSLDGIPLLLSRYYPDMRFSEEQLFELYTRGTLTPGDFGSLKGRTDYLAESEVTPDYVIKSLSEISTARRMAEE